MTPEADAGREQWPCRLPMDLSQALAEIQKDMRASKSVAVRYVLQLGVESWRLRQKEARHLDRLVADGLTMEAILPYLGSRLTSPGGRSNHKPGR